MGEDEFVEYLLENEQLVGGDLIESAVDYDGLGMSGDGRIEAARSLLPDG